MSFRWNEGVMRANNIVDADAFNTRYNKLKSGLNGDVDRDQLPGRAITAAMTLNECFHRCKVAHFSLNDPYRVRETTGVNATVQLPGVQYEQYTGGNITSDVVEFNTAEGMLKIEASCVVRLVQSNLISGATRSWPGVDNMIRWGSFRILVNGTAVISDLFKVWMDWNTIFLVGDIPVTEGLQSIQLQWATRPRGTVTNTPTEGQAENISDESNKCVFYFDAGNVLLINRYR